MNPSHVFRRSQDNEEQLIPPLAVLRRSSFHAIPSYIAPDGYEGVHKQVTDPNSPNHEELRRYWQRVLPDGSAVCFMGLEIENTHGSGRQDQFSHYKPVLRWVVESDAALFADSKLALKLRERGEKQRDLKDLNPKEQKAWNSYRKAFFASLIVMGADNDVLTGKISIDKACERSDKFIFLEATGVPPCRSLHISVPSSLPGYVYAQQLAEFCQSLVNDRRDDLTYLRISSGQSQGTAKADATSLPKTVALYAGKLKGFKQIIAEHD